MLSQASWLVAIMFAFLLGFASIRAEEIPAGIMPQRRQVAGTGVTTSSNPPDTTTSSNPPAQSTTPTTSDNTPTTSDDNTPTTSDAPTTQDNTQSTTKETTIPVTTTNADGSTITSQISTNTLVAASDSAVETKTGTDNSVVRVGSKTIDPATLSKKTTVKQPLVTKETRHQTYTSFWTSNGHVYSSVYTTENVFASTTGFATATIAPSLANGGGDGSNLSSHTKAIIGGVVGGVGGAILIGGLAFVAWRLWGKKKQQEDQDEYSWSPHDSLNAQKRYSANTLSTDAYNQPNRVNTASNF